MWNNADEKVWCEASGGTTKVFGKCSNPKTKKFYLTANITNDTVLDKQNLKTLPSLIYTDRMGDYSTELIAQLDKIGGQSIKLKNED